jgi:hypothetical protein
MRKIEGLSWVFGLTLFAAGCSSDRARCETLCEWLEECVSEDVSCSDEDLDDCEDDLEDLSDDCHDSLASFTDCLDENDNDCSDIEADCQGEASDFAEQCNGEFD